MFIEINVKKFPVLLMVDLLKTGFVFFFIILLVFRFWRGTFRSGKILQQLEEKPVRRNTKDLVKLLVEMFIWCADSNLFWIMLPTYILQLQCLILSLWWMFQFCSVGRSSRRPNYQLKVPADLLHRDRRPLRFGLNHLCQVVIPVLFEGCMLSLLVMNFISDYLFIFLHEKDIVAF